MDYLSLRISTYVCSLHSSLILLGNGPHCIQSIAFLFIYVFWWPNSWCKLWKKILRIENYALVDNISPSEIHKRFVGKRKSLTAFVLIYFPARTVTEKKKKLQVINIFLHLPSINSTFITS